MISNHAKLRLLFVANLSTMAVNAVVAEIAVYKGSVWPALLSMLCFSVAFACARSARKAMRREDKLDIALGVMRGYLPFNKLTRDGLRLSVDGTPAFLIPLSGADDPFFLAAMVYLIRDDHPAKLRLWLNTPGTVGIGLHDRSEA